MIKLGLKYYFLGLVFVLSFCSCTSLKKQIVVEKDLVTVSSYYQKVIPGQANQKTKFNLYIELKDNLNVIDSISYHGSIKFPIKRNNYYETDLGKDIDKRGAEIIIFYHNEERLLKSLLRNILIKEPLYLP